ncbi:MAG TPA: response regulator [bacterium]|nr:response regulator [bacterium]
MAKILLVDDSRVMLKVIRRAVCEVRPGDEIVMASSGEEAIELAGRLEGELAAALIDYNMGGMNGIECADRLRAMHPTAGLALCTANAQNAVAERARGLGLGVLHKPVDEQKLRELFDGWQSAANPAPAASLPVTELTDDQADVLKEAFNIGVGQSAAALTRLIGGDREIQLSVPAIELTTIAELARRVSPGGADVCAVMQRYHGPIQGKAHLLYSAAESLELARELIGTDTAVEQLSEMESDALREIGNIVLNACVSTFGNMFEIEIHSDVPHVVTDSAMAVLTDFGARSEDEQLLYLRMDFNLRDRDLQGHLSFTMGEQELADLMGYIDRFLDGVPDD